MDNWNGNHGHSKRGQWLVEKLLDECGEGDSTKYLVRWKGWSNAHDSSVGASWLHHRPKLITDFEADKGWLDQEAVEAQRAARAAAEQRQRRERAPRRCWWFSSAGKLTTV